MPVAHVPQAQVVGPHTVLGIALSIDALDAVIVDEVVEVRAAPRDVQQFVHIGKADAVHTGLFPVHFKAQARGVFRGVEAYVRQKRALARVFQQGVAGFGQHLIAHAGAVFKAEVETGGRTEAGNGRRLVHHDLGFLELGEDGVGTARDGGGVLPLAFAFRPVLERKEALANALAFACEGEAEGHAHAGHGVLFFFHEVVFDALHHFQRLGAGRAARQFVGNHEAALVFTRDEGRGQYLEEVDHACRDSAVQQEAEPRMLQPRNDMAAVGRGQAGEEFVEAGTARAAGLPLVLFKDSGAKRRGEHDGHGHGKEHGRHDGDGELPVDDTHRTAEEGHRKEHGGQNHGNAHDGAGDLLHALLGGLVGRKAFRGHQSFHVFHDHDGVVHEQADGQHHAEQRQRIDGEAAGRKDAERAEEHHGHGQRGNDGGAKIMQEEQEREEDEHDGFEQRTHHALDGRFDEGRCVEDHAVFQPLGEIGLHLFQLFHHAVAGLESVGVGTEVDAEVGARAAVVAGIHAVAALAEFHAGHVFKAEQGTVGQGADDDLLELIGQRHAFLRRHHDVHGRVGRLRKVAKLTGGDLRVLRLDRGGDVRRRELVGGKTFGVQPDADGALGTVKAYVAHAGDTGQRVGNVRAHVVDDIGIGHAAVRGNEGQHAHEVGIGLVHAHAVLLHAGRKVAHGKLDLVHHLGLGDVVVDGRVEGEAQADGAGHVAVGFHVHQAVEALHLLFDDLRGGIFHAFGRCAVIGGGNGDGRRRDLGIHGDRQGIERQRAEKHDHDGEHPCKNGAVDEELCHSYFPSAASVTFMPGFT